MGNSPVPISHRTPDSGTLSFGLLHCELAWKSDKK